MSDIDRPSPPAEEFTFDVVISIPEWVEKSIVEERARKSLGAPPEVIDHIMASLAKHRVLKVKADVTREKAERSASRFESVGFRAEITHSLKLKKLSQKVADDKTQCPACDAMIKPGPDSQCTHCGVIINSLTPEFLARKAQMRKEKEQLESELREKRRREDEARRIEFEQKVREEIRAELQGKIGPPWYRRMLTPALVAVAAVGAFMGGHYWFPQPLKAVAQSGHPATEKQDDIEKVISQTNQLQADMAKMSTAPNPDALDAKPLIDPKDSLSNAVPLRTSLANPGESAASAASSSGPTANSTGDTAGNTAGNTTAASAPVAGTIKDEEIRRELGYKLIVTLAEMGQLERAHDLLDKIIASRNTGADLALSSQLRAVQLEVEAWDIVYGHGDKPQEKIDALSKMVADLPNPNDRTLTSVRIGAIVLKRADLLPQAADSLFNVANESYKANKDPAIGTELLIWRGRGLFNSARTRIERGLRQQATNLTGQLGTMTRIAPGQAQAALYCFDQQLSRLMGNNEGAQLSLNEALLKIEKLPSLQQQAATMRILAEGDGMYQNNTVQTSLAALIATTEKTASSEYLPVLLELGLMHAENGNETELRLIQHKMAEAVKNKPDQIKLEERLRGFSELGLALKARKSGNLAGVESHLRQVAALAY